MKSTKNVCRTIITLGTLALFLNACGPQQNQTPYQSSAPDASATNNIIGGTVVSSADVISKTTVALIIIDSSNPLQVSQGTCTGTLLSQNLILTAAHCIPARGAIIAAFASNWQEVTSPTHPKARRVTAVEVHPEAFLNAQRGLDKDFADLAILKFEGTLPAGYRTVQLLPPSRSLRNGNQVTLAGYGVTDGKTGNSDNFLRKTTVTVANPRFSATEVLMDETKGRSSCNGDSGGPAFTAVNGVQMQFGVLSRGYNDPTQECKGFSVYTNINAHLPWINSTKQKLLAVATTALASK
ncbi:MAG: S1 family peptidase [Pseudobdellovibrionaceae bacterium]